MDLLIVLVVLGIVIAVVVSRSQRREKQRELDALQAVKGAAEEDVTRFGEDVALLGNDNPGGGPICTTLRTGPMSSPSSSVDVQIAIAGRSVCLRAASVSSRISFERLP